MNFIILPDREVADYIASGFGYTAKALKDGRYALPEWVNAAGGVYWAVKNYPTEDIPLDSALWAETPDEKWLNDYHSGRTDARR